MLCLTSPRLLEPIYDSFFLVTRVCDIHIKIWCMLSLFNNLVIHNNIGFNRLWLHERENK